MRTEIEKINAAKAVQYLKRNDDNRPLRKTVVENLKEAWLRGEYVMSHQGIAFDTAGNLVDGQHRLTALSEMPPNFTAEMLVCRGVPPAAKKVMDIGYKRTASDILGEGREIVETARFLAMILLGKKNGATPAYLVPIVERIRRPHDDLMEFCPTKCRMWSSAPIRAAAVIVGMAGGDIDFAKLVYRAMVTKDFSTMPTSAQAMFRSHISGKVRAAQSLDAFVRALKIFDPANASLSKIQVKDVSPAVERVRALLRHEIHGAAASGNGSAKPTTKAPSSRRANPNYALAGI